MCARDPLLTGSKASRDPKSEEQCFAYASFPVDAVNDAEG